MSDYDYDVFNSTLATEGIWAGILAIFGIILVIGLIIGIVQIIGMWKMLKKAGKPGWGSIIPIYNVYLLCKISGVNPWWLLVVFLSPVLAIIPILGELAIFAISIYFMILLSVSLARSFGKEDIFAAGLIFLSPIFYLILGCGSSKYEGEKPMNDIIFNKIKGNNNVNNQNTNDSVNDNQNTQNSNVKYCASCGSQVDVNTRFCPNCGKEII